MTVKLTIILYYVVQIKVEALLSFFFVSIFFYCFLCFQVGVVEACKSWSWQMSHPMNITTCELSLL